MITRRYREPRGLHSGTADYGFFVRVSGDERDLLKAARRLAERRLGGPPSNPMLLLDMMSVYVGDCGAVQAMTSKTILVDDEDI